MQAYRLRHRITLQKKAEPDRDGDGYIIPGSGGWHTVVLKDGTELKDVPAEVLTGPGREFQGGAATQSETAARINMRWFPSLEDELAAWRVLWDGRVYNITSANTDGTARREWRLRATYGPSEGQ